MGASLLALAKSIYYSIYTVQAQRNDCNATFQYEYKVYCEIRSRVKACFQIQRDMGKTILIKIIIC